MNEHLSWQNLDGVLVFRFHGSIQSDISADLRAQIIQVIREQRSSAVVFHLGDATTIDSVGIGMFVHLHVQNHERIRFIFCELSGGVSKAFGYVKLISFFDIRDTLDDALRELRDAVR